MRIVEAITSRFRQEKAQEKKPLTLEDHPLVKKAKNMLFVVRTEMAAAALGVSTWGIYNLTAQTPEAVNINFALGVGLFISIHVAAWRNANNYSRLASDLNNSYLSRLPGS